jgi:hypothetical protein
MLIIVSYMGGDLTQEAQPLFVVFSSSSAGSYVLPTWVVIRHNDLTRQGLDYDFKLTRSSIIHGLDARTLQVHI